MSDYRIYQPVKHIKDATRPQMVMQMELRTNMLIEDSWSPEWKNQMREEIKQITDCIYAQWAKEN